MSASAVSQFYKGLVKIGSVIIPVLSEPVLQLPDGLVAPPCLGSYAVWNHSADVINPTLSLSFAARDVAGEVFSQAFLDQFITRSNDAAHDTSEISGGIQFWDSRGGWTLYGAKCDSFSLEGAKTPGGGMVRFSANFCAANDSTHLAVVALNSQPSFSGHSDNKILNFENITFANTLAGKVWSFGLTFSNNHVPSMTLDGTKYPAAQNAAQWSAGFQYRAMLVDEPPTDGTPIIISIAGVTVNTTFTINNPWNTTRRNRTLSAPHIMRNHSYLCKGGTSLTCPITIGYPS